jgi:hypothetical protein
MSDEVKEWRDKYQAAQDTIDRLLVVIKLIFLGAVTRNDPCPFCEAPTTNISPYAEHHTGCVVIESISNG